MHLHRRFIYFLFYPISIIGLHLKFLLTYVGNSQLHIYYLHLWLIKNIKLHANQVKQNAVVSTKCRENWTNKTFQGSSKTILSLLILKVSQAYTGLSSIKRDKIRYILPYVIFTFYNKCIIPTWLESFSCRILKPFKQSRDRILSLVWED